MMLKKFCPHQGCKELIPQNQAYCAKHDNRADYNRDIRKGIDKQYDDFYHEPTWKRVRMQAVIRDHGLCVECLKQGKIAQYHVVHHIRPVKTPGGWQHRYDINNLVCVCEACHQRLHGERNGR